MPLKGVLPARPLRRVRDGIQRQGLVRQHAFNSAQITSGNVFALSELFPGR
jgi:hypothetical protein